MLFKSLIVLPWLCQEPGHASDLEQADILDLADVWGYTVIHRMADMLSSFQTRRNTYKEKLVDCPKGINEIIVLHDLPRTKFVTVLVPFNFWHSLVAAMVNDGANKIDAFIPSFKYEDHDTFLPRMEHVSL